MRAASLSFEALLLVAASALCGCGNSGAPETKLFGTVTFSETAALPPGARLEVRLEDAGQSTGAAASGAGLSPSPAAAIATQTVDVGGRRPPSEFTLPVPRNALLPRHEYILRAEIRAPAGDLLYRGLPDQRPIGNPNTTGRVELMLIPASR
jgi:putative lipoprotein